MIFIVSNLQRQLSRKEKFSSNWQKQKRKIQLVHSHIINIRRDYLHKVTSEISKNHAMIVFVVLKVGNMSKSAKGTAEQYWRNVRAKSGLNRSILDPSWYEIRRQLEYMQLWRGGQVSNSSGIHQPAVRLLWVYGERKPPDAK